MLRPQDGIQVDKFYPPTDWLDNNSQQIDIRKNAENNSIVLLVGHSADYTKYSLLGLLVAVSSGTYDVYIDDVLVGSGITSNTQYDIDFSTIITTFGTATTPESLVLHKVVVKPTTTGESITSFGCRRTSGVTSTQTQGLLWCYLSLTNRISLTGTNTIISKCLSFEGKGNLIKVRFNATNFLRGYQSLVYLSILDLSNDQYVNQMFYRCNEIKRIIITKGSVFDKNWTSFDGTFYDCYKLEQVNMGSVENLGQRLTETFRNNTALKLFPIKQCKNTVVATTAITHSQALLPTKLDFSTAKNLTIIGTYGSSTYPMQGLRGLKVSNEAPFSGSSPQINVSYTGLDREALVELFNSLPYNVGYTEVGSPMIVDGVVSGFSASDYLTISQSSGTVNSIEIIIKVQDVASTITHTGLIIGLNGNLNSRLAIGTNGRVQCNYRDVDNTTRYLSSSKQVSEYNYMRVKFNTTGASLDVSTDGITWINEYTREEIPNLTSAFTSCSMGYISNTYNSFEGSINLPKTSIKLNNKLWFNGQAQMTKTLSLVGATGNNLAKVGSPTIDENGVASGFDSSNYLKLTQSFSVTNIKKVEEQVVFTTGTIGTQQLIMGGQYSAGSFGFELRTNGKMMFRVTYVDVGNTTRYAEAQCDTILNANTKYKAIGKFDRKDLSIKLEIYNENNTLVDEKTSIITSSSFSSLSGFGEFFIGAHSQRGNFNGSIDLENTLIKIDRNYLMKGYITDNDKNIALNKGWQLTLS